MRCRWPTKLSGARGLPALGALILLVPLAPAASSEPLDPPASIAAEKPGQPAKPDKPDEPGKPDKPGKPGKPDKPDEPGKPGKPDTLPPAAPALQSTRVGAGGMVTVVLVAEKGSRLVVTEDRAGSIAGSAGAPSGDGAEDEAGSGPREISRAVATGAAQELSWGAEHGDHVYELVATDEAGNASQPTAVSLTVDARPPALRRLVVESGTPDDTRSWVRFGTERGASYRLLVDGSLIIEGVFDSRVEQMVDVADGNHAVTVEVRDETGNVRTARRRLEVRIRGLLVDAEVLTESTESRQSVRVRATPNATRATLRIPGRADRRISLRRGRGTVQVRLPDGTYIAPRVTVVDTQGRTGAARLASFTVDTTGPTLAVLPDASEAGRLAFSVEAEPGDVVSWRVLNGDDVVVGSGRYVAGASVETIEREVTEGRHQVEVTATDTYGRTTVERLSVPVAASPSTAGRLALLASAAGVPLVAVVAGGLLWRRRRVPAAEGRPRGLYRPGREGGDPVPARRGEPSAPLDTDAQWNRRRESLAALHDAASVVLADGTSERAEVTLHTAPARLLADADGGGLLTVVDAGVVVVTDRRISFHGDCHREWILGGHHCFRHVAHDRTLVKSEQDDGWWGIGYDDPEVTRLALDFALSDRPGTRGSLVHALTQWLRQHELRRPSPVG